MSQILPSFFDLSKVLVIANAVQNEIECDF